MNCEESIGKEDRSIRKFITETTEKSAKVLLYIAGIALVIMVLITTFDVVGRYALGKIIPSTYEMVESLLVIVIYFTLPYIQVQEKHIRISTVIERVSARKGIALGAIAWTGGFFLFSLITWQSVLQAWHSWTIKEYSPGIMPFPVYPVRFALALGTFVLSMQLLVASINCFKALWKKCDPKCTQTRAIDNGNG